jgi:glycogen(starch) synthase
VKVLMLGWEFPPHISGGLGTACYGLTQGLARQGVEVLFVVPKAWGDEPQEFARVIGCDQVDLPPEPAGLELETAAARGISSVPKERAASAVALARSAAATHGEAPASERLATTATAPDRTAEEHARGALAHPAPAQGPGGEPFPTAKAQPRDPALEALRRIEVVSALRPYEGQEAYRERISSEAQPPAEAWPAPRAVDPALAATVAELRALLATLPEIAHALDAARAEPDGAHMSLPKAAAAAREPPAAPAAPGAPNAPSSTPPPAPAPRRLAFAGGYGRDLLSEVARYALVVGEIAKNEDFDLIHAHDWMCYPAGLVAARVSGRPLVVHLHASEYDRSGEHPDERIRKLEELGLTGADRVICVSHYTAAVARTRYGADPERLRVVHNAVTHKEQTEIWHWEKTIPEPVVLFLGRVTFQKGPEYFLEAAALVVQVEKRIKFVMGGSGDMLPGMVERAARLGLARHVHFTGFLRGADVERIYALADIYVMPSVSEPFGISPLEAMALDVPVIVSRQSGVSEILRNALKVDFWDVKEIANKILAVLRYPALREELVEEGRGEVRALRWEVRAQHVREVYEEVVG